jgi:hypothetical protein
VVPQLLVRPNLVRGAAALFVALLVATLAVVDHRHVGRRSHGAAVAGWYCEMKGTHCDELQPGTLESRWEVRERSYEALFGVALVVAVGAGTSALRRRRA